ncbi:hypothetical protein C3E77_03350 [Mycetocola zhujimingii]|nr:hypothetical protein C3E77_03350 [Mycetocola zhujimingii]
MRQREPSRRGAPRRGAEPGLRERRPPPVERPSPRRGRPGPQRRMLRHPFARRESTSRCGWRR